MSVRVMLVLPTLTQMLLEKKNKKVHLLTGVFNAGSKKVHSLLLLLSARVGIYDSRMNVS